MEPKWNLKEYNAWESILLLLKKLEWQEIGRKYDTGDRQSICPVCRDPKSIHDIDCEIGNAISAIESILNKPKDWSLDYGKERNE